MSRRAVTKDFYDLLVAAFRETGNNAAAAARIVKCRQETARKAYDVGWPNKGFTAVRDVFRDEQIAARAAERRAEVEKVRARQQEAEEARQHAVDARIEEAKIVQRSRRSSLAELSVLTPLLLSAQALAARVRKELETLSGGAADVDPAKALSMLRQVVLIGETIRKSAAESMAMERLHLGQPTDIIRVVDGEDEEMTLEQARERVEAARQAVEDAGRAKLRVVGGAAAELEVGVEIEEAAG